jgi:hypothetical protein
MIRSLTLLKAYPLIAIAVVAAACVASCGLSPVTSPRAPTALGTSATPVPTTPSLTLPPEKQADEDARASALAAAQAANASAGVKKQDYASPPSATADPGTILDPHYTAGAGTVFDPADAPPGSDAVITDQWFETKAPGDFVSVFAGRDASKPTDGMLLITVDLQTYARYDAPGAHGALRIVGATGEVLALLAEDGKPFTFDVPSRTFG